MADRVSASITIGGTLPAAELPDFLAAVDAEALSTEWDGAPFTADQLPENGSLMLMAHEVAWGEFEELEAFCIEHRLPFARWWGACADLWSAGRVVFTGSGESRSFIADEDDRVLIDRGTIEQLGSIDAVLAHFDAADFAIPPLLIADGE